MTEMRAPRHGHWRVVSRLGLAAAIVASLLAFPATASASTGCQGLNQPSLDGLYYGKEITLSRLVAGDFVRISAGFPTRPIPPATSYVPSSLHLILDGTVVVATATFPGTAEWVVPEDVEAPRLRWITNSDNTTRDSAEVTWAISCQDAPPPADTQPPSVTINQAAAQADPTNASAIQFAVHFSEPVTLFDATDVTLSGSAAATTAAVSGSGTDYTVSVSGMTGSGSVVASIGAGAATDGAGNVSTAATSTDNVVTYDIAAPVLSLPPGIVVDATSASGATVTYSATATDNDGTSRPVSCSSASGSTFPLGSTAVSCMATDAAGNSASGGFTVTVQDVVAQLENLTEEVDGVGPGESLASKLRGAREAEVSGDTARACSLLSDFLNQVKAQRDKSLTSGQADELTSDAMRIRSLLGC